MLEKIVFKKKERKKEKLQNYDNASYNVSYDGGGGQIKGHKTTCVA